MRKEIAYLQNIGIDRLWEGLVKLSYLSNFKSFDFVITENIGNQQLINSWEAKSALIILDHDHLPCCVQVFRGSLLRVVVAVMFKKREISVGFDQLRTVSWNKFFLDVDRIMSYNCLHYILCPRKCVVRWLICRRHQIFHIVSHEMPISGKLQT